MLMCWVWVWVMGVGGVQRLLRGRPWLLWWCSLGLVVGQPVGPGTGEDHVGRCGDGSCCVWAGATLLGSCQDQVVVVLSLVLLLLLLLSAVEPMQQQGVRRA
jgi:hypothetical protein